MIIKSLAFVFGLIVLLLIVALFTRKNYSLKRSVVINRSVEQVYDYVKYLKNQDKFSKWAQIDPDMRKTFTGTDGTVGFVLAWDSDKKEAGKGEQEIKKIDEPNRIDYEIRFFKPFPGLAQSYLKLEPISAGSTRVTWGFDSKMAYPMNLMLVVMNMENMIGKDLEIGLANLKRNLEIE